MIIKMLNALCGSVTTTAEAVELLASAGKELAHGTQITAEAFKIQTALRTEYKHIQVMQELELEFGKRPEAPITP